MSKYLTGKCCRVCGLYFVSDNDLEDLCVDCGRRQFHLPSTKPRRFGNYRLKV